MTKVAVVGLGKIGLPLAALYASKGMDVIGCDIDASIVEAVNAGHAPFEEPGLSAALRNAHDASKLRATTDTAGAVADSDVVVIMVRVDIDVENRTDYSTLDAATDAIAKGLKPGTLVILESTVPVGATRKHLGAKLGGDVKLAYSPERVSSGSIFRDLATYPKLVGGVDRASGEAAAEFYRGVLDSDVMLLPDAETAEFAKLAESVYRDVNIALANELAKAAETLGVDFSAAAQAANSQPYSHLHAPGVGVGGHCIPVYPHFLLEATDQPIVRLARETNDAMAGYAVEKLADALGGLEGKTVLVLGLAYRGGVKEAMLSSALLLAAALKQRGATALVHDPMFSADEVLALNLIPATLPPAAPVDAVILQALHQEYREMDLASLGARVFLDGRGAIDRKRVEAAGMRYLRIGG